VMPYDVPMVNPLAKTLRHLDDYERKADWVNFKLGLPFQDAETSFLLDRILANQTLRPVTAGPGAAHGCVLGMDVGKTCWITIYRPEGLKLQLIYCERVKQGTAAKVGNAIARCQELMDFFGVKKAVIDAGPDFTTALTLIQQNPVGRVFGCYYVRSVGNKLTNFLIDDAEGVVKADRTKCFDSLAKAANGGRIQFPQCPEQETVRKHLLAMKRVTHMNNQGEYINHWTSVDEDHYAHAMNYGYLAYQLLDHNVDAGVTPALPMAGTTKVKSHKEIDGATTLPVLRELNRGQYGR